MYAIQYHNKFLKLTFTFLTRTPTIKFASHIFCRLCNKIEFIKISLFVELCQILHMLYVPLNEKQVMYYDE